MDKACKSNAAPFSFRVILYNMYYLYVLKSKVNRKHYVGYTSDLKGTYEVILEGFTTYGKPVSVRNTIEVR